MPCARHDVGRDGSVCRRDAPSAFVTSARRSVNVTVSNMYVRPLGPASVRRTERFALPRTAARRFGPEVPAVFAASRALLTLWPRRAHKARCAVSRQGSSGAVLRGVLH